MERSLFALCFAVVLLGSCTGSKTQSVAQSEPSEQPSDSIAADDESAEMPVGADELFDDFVFNFASNRALQMERICFPLPVFGTDNEQTTMLKKQWQMERFFMEQDFYTLIFDNQEQMELVNDTALVSVTVEKFMLTDSIVKQYLFTRTDGRWMLTQIKNQRLSHNPNAQFLSFYSQFVADSVFQYNSLSEQIAFTGPDPEDDFAQLDGVITPDFWGAFAPELPSDMLYNIVYGMQDPASTQKIFVLRGIANGLETELTFVLRNGRWKLVRLTT
jgi:hypothetical protein